MGASRSVILDIESKGLSHDKAHVSLAKDGKFVAARVEEVSAAEKTADVEHVQPSLDEVVEITVVEQVPAVIESIAIDAVIETTIDPIPVKQPVENQVKSKFGKKRRD